MSEKHFVAEFIQTLDFIMKSDLPGLSHAKTLGVENTENKDLLVLAGKISEIDYCSDSKIREILQRQLFRKMKGRNGGDELSDDQLDCAAGGLDEFKGKKID